jgi:type I restriction enzyme S subunit
MITAVDCTIIRFNKAQVAPEFFNYYSQSNDYLEAINLQTTGTTRNRISRNKLGLISIPVPPLPEQQRIVAMLDAAFASIATAKSNTEQNLKNARALFDSYLHEVFSQRGNDWIETHKPLSDLCELIVDCEHKTAPTQEEGIPSIRTPNTGKGKLLLDGVYRVSEETYNEWTRRAEPKAGDLILAREAPAGNVAVIPENTRVCLGQRTVLIRPNNNIFESEFLTFLLLCPDMREKLLAHSRGATVQHVNMKDIRALNVGAIPPVENQKFIVSKLNTIIEETQRLETLYQRKLTALDELKKALLHQAFNGEL